MFLRAGLTQIQFVSMPIEMGYPEYARLVLLQQRLHAAVAAGDITLDEAASFIAALEQRHREGTFYASLIGYMALGTKA
jgi:isochorismate synthase EntC